MDVPSASSGLTIADFVRNISPQEIRSRTGVAAGRGQAFLQAVERQFGPWFAGQLRDNLVRENILPTPQNPHTDMARLKTVARHLVQIEPQVSAKIQDAIDRTLARQAGYSAYRPLWSVRRELTTGPDRAMRAQMTRLVSEQVLNALFFDEAPPDAALFDFARQSLTPEFDRRLGEWTREAYNQSLDAILARPGRSPEPAPGPPATRATPQELLAAKRAEDESFDGVLEEFEALLPRNQQPQPAATGDFQDGLIGFTVPGTRGTVRQQLGRTSWWDERVLWQDGAIRRTPLTQLDSRGRWSSSAKIENRRTLLQLARYLKDQYGGAIAKRLFTAGGTWGLRELVEQGGDLTTGLLKHALEEARSLQVGEAFVGRGWDGPEVPDNRDLLTGNLRNAFDQAMYETGNGRGWRYSYEASRKGDDYYRWNGLGTLQPEDRLDNKRTILAFMEYLRTSEPSFTSDQLHFIFKRHFGEAFETGTQRLQRGLVRTVLAEAERLRSRNTPPPPPAPDLDRPQRPRRHSVDVPPRLGELHIRPGRPRAASLGASDPPQAQPSSRPGEPPEDFSSLSDPEDDEEGLSRSPSPEPRTHSEPGPDGKTGGPRWRTKSEDLPRRVLRGRDVSLPPQPEVGFDWSDAAPAYEALLGTAPAAARTRMLRRGPIEIGALSKALPPGDATRNRQAIRDILLHMENAHGNAFAQNLWASHLQEHYKHGEAPAAAELAKMYASLVSQGTRDLQAAREEVQRFHLEMFSSGESLGISQARAGVVSHIFLARANAEAELAGKPLGRARLNAIATEVRDRYAPNHPDESVADRRERILEQRLARAGISRANSAPERLNRGNITQSGAFSFRSDAPDSLTAGTIVDRFNEMKDIGKFVKKVANLIVSIDQIAQDTGKDLKIDVQLFQEIQLAGAWEYGLGLPSEAKRFHQYLQRCQERGDAVGELAARRAATEYMIAILEQRLAGGQDLADDARAGIESTLQRLKQSSAKFEAELTAKLISDPRGMDHLCQFIRYMGSMTGVIANGVGLTHHAASFVSMGTFIGNVAANWLAAGISAVRSSRDYSDLHRAKQIRARASITSRKAWARFNPRTGPAHDPMLKAWAQMHSQKVAQGDFRPKDMVSSDARLSVARSLRRSANVGGARLAFARNVSNTGSYGLSAAVATAAAAGAATGPIGWAVTGATGVALGAYAALGTGIGYGHGKVRSSRLDRSLQEWQEAFVHQRGPKWESMRQAGVPEPRRLEYAFQNMVRKDPDLAASLFAAKLQEEAGRLAQASGGRPDFAQATEPHYPWIYMLREDMQPYHEVDGKLHRHTANVRWKSFVDRTLLSDDPAYIARQIQYGLREFRAK